MHGNTTHWPTIPSTVDGSDLSILTPTAGQLKQGRPKEKERRKKRGKTKRFDRKDMHEEKRDRKRERRGEIYFMLYYWPQNSMCKKPPK